MSVDLEALRRAAEAEMLREAPDGPGGRPAKRQRRHDDDGEGALAVGRYDYAAARSAQGPAFLLSCNFRREKSAVKEAVAALQQYLPSGSSYRVPAAAAADARPPAVQPAADAAAPQHREPVSREPCSAAADTDGAARRGCAEEQQPAEQPAVVATSAAAVSDDAPLANGMAAALPTAAGGLRSMPTDAETSSPVAAQPAKPTNAAAAAGAALSSATADDGSVGLSVVKLGCSGLMLLQARGLEPGAATSAVAALLADMASETQRGLEHCHRIVPVEAISELSEATLVPSVRSVVATFLSSATAAQLPRPCGYAVAFKQRGPAGGGVASAAAPSAPAPKTSAVAAPTLPTAAAAADGAATAAIAAEAAPPQPPAEPSATQGSQPAKAAGGGGVSGACAAVPAQPLSRTSVIQTLASAAAGAAAAAGIEVHVDLKTPDWALVAEALPVAAASGLLVGLAAVPAAMLTLKPKLIVKATAAGAK